MGLTILMLSAVVAFVVFNILYSLYTGETNISYRMVSRRENKRFFWLAIYVNALVGIGTSIVIILTALGIMH